MKGTIFLFVFFSITSLSFGQIDEHESIDSIFSEWSVPNSPGCALGIIKDGNLIYAEGYGLANMEYDIPNAASSVFRIGSTSKQFTAACIVLLAEREQLSLDNTLDQYFPDFPKYAKRITIRNLLNHTSGIRDYLMITYLKGFRDDEYYEDQDIMDWLTSQEDLNFKPGTEFLYSNSGYWLLGQIVGEVAGMNMADFAQKELFEPLGMRNTHFHNDHTQIVKNRASGYYPTEDESYQISMTNLDMIGDGGIFTSIDDIKKWDDAFYSSSVLSKEFWKMMTQQGVLNSGDEIDYAAGLFMGEYKGLKTISHGGAFVGFRAELIRFPEQGVSIAIFANRGDANPTRKAYQVADILLKDQFIVEEEKDDGEEPMPEASQPAVELSLEQLIGVYQIEPGVTVKLSAVDDSLSLLQSWNESSYNIGRTSGNTFQIPGEANVSFVFSELKDGLTQRLTVYQGGNASVCERKEEIDLSKIDLDDYVGDFFSSELDATYRIYLQNGGLTIQVRNNEPAALIIIDKDNLTFYGNTLRFKKKGSKVSGFELDAGRVKNLKFKKV